MKDLRKNAILLPIGHTANIECKVIKGPFSVPLHYHDCFELCYVLCGRCEHTIQGKMIDQCIGECSCLPSESIHQLEVPAECKVISVKIASEFFRSLDIPDMVAFTTPVTYSCGTDAFIPDLLLKMSGQQASDHKSHQMIILKSLFTTAVNYCLQNFGGTESHIEPLDNTRTLLWNIMRYAYINYNTVTLASVSEHFHLSESYVCRLFKKAAGGDGMNVTFTQMIRRHRMQHAAEYLTTTHLKLGEICRNVGYKDTTQFIKDFKKEYGTTPAKYRKSVSSCP